MGPIVDRSKEHLGTSDVAIIAARRRLLRMLRELEQGIEPYGPHHGEIFAVRSLDLISPEAEFETLLAQYAGDLRIEAELTAR